MTIWKKILCVFLFLATFASTSLAQGWMFGLTIVLLLLAHELAHFFTSRKYGVSATWPYFIPMPNIFGTMGAVISMNEPMPSRKALFDIGISGPLAGIILAVPAMIYGLSLSHIDSVPSEGVYLFLGEPPLFQWLSALMLGPVPQGQHVVLHPVAFAAWAVLFITAINMVPVGQLDGGHVVYALFGKQARFVTYIAIALFLFLGIQYHPIWIFFLVVTVFISFWHPDPIDTHSPIGARRVILAALTYLLVALCFTPVPFELKIQ